MLIAWMIYAVALTTIVAGCAIALDRLAEIWSISRRGIWLAALVIAIVVPIGLAVRPVPQARTMPAGPAPAGDSVRVSLQALPKSGRTPELDGSHEVFLKRLPRSAILPPSWNRFVGAAWLVASLALVALLFSGIVALWRGRAHWKRSIVDGHPVLVTKDVGPAVVGILTPTILVPAWALKLGAPERQLMLEHEAEHVRAKDPVLIAIAAWSVALVPWNPAVWFMVRRLRLAIEIDCDRRVLDRQTANARDYGLLLLTVGARSAGGLRFAASLAEPRHFLEQRILAMTAARPSRPFIASAPFVALAFLAAVAVAQTPRPESTLVVRRTPPRVALTRDTLKVAEPPRLEAVPTVERHRERIAQGRTAPLEPPRIVTGMPSSSTQPLSIDVVRAWIQIRHPSVIAGDPHVNAVTIVVDENNNLLASVADSLEAEASGSAPRILVRGRLPGEPAEIVRGPKPGAPVIMVDGVRIDSTAQLDTIPIESIEVIKGKSAAAEYGPDAEAGIIVIRSMRPDEAQLRRLGVSPDNVKEMTELRLRPGVIGPNRLYVAVLQLKKY